MRQAKKHGKARDARKRGASGLTTALAALKRRRNGADAAANAEELFRQFHGKESTGYTEYEIPGRMPADQSDLGRLIELVVWTDEDDARELQPRRDVRVTCVARKVRGELIGTQIYFVGGDQTLNLAALDRDQDQAPTDHVMIGPCQAIAYHTSKDFHNFEPSDYEHQFGEETGELPFLAYDTRHRLISLIGGAYRVERPGIIN